jgi:putative copper export protein
MSHDDAFVVAQSVARSLIYASTLWAIGVCSTLALVAPTAHPALWRWARRATGLVVVAYLARFYVQTVETYYSPFPTWHSTYMLLFSTLGWGKGVLAQFVIAVVAWRVAATADGRARGRLLLTGVAASLGLAVPLAGHAIAHGGLLATVVQGAHVAAAGAWVGGLATLVLAWRRGLLAVADVGPTLTRFSLVARWSVALLVVSGAGAIWTHVDDPGAMFTTWYGILLSAKVAAFSGAAVLGWLHSRDVQRILIDQNGRRMIRATVVWELALAVVAMLLVAVFAGLPRPGDLRP